MDIKSIYGILVIVLLTNAIYQWLFYVTIKDTPLMLPLPDLKKVLI